jgi:hypothetical protein
MTCEEFST